MVQLAGCRTSNLSGARPSPLFMCSGCFSWGFLTPAEQPDHCLLVYPALSSLGCCTLFKEIIYIHTHIYIKRDFYSFHTKS